MLLFTTNADPREVFKPCRLEYDFKNTQVWMDTRIHRTWVVRPTQHQTLRVHFAVANWRLALGYESTTLFAEWGSFGGHLNVHVDDENHTQQEQGRDGTRNP